MHSNNMAADTLAVHAGEHHPDGAVITPVYQSAMFKFAADAEVESLKYLRYNNSPNQTALQEKLAALERAEAGLVCASGMAAITAAVMCTLRPGDHVLAQEGLYGGTLSLFRDELPQRGIDVDFVNKDDRDQWRACLRPSTKVFYCESLTNPLLHVADLRGIAEFAGEHKLLSIVDATFTPPCNFRPLDLGFDLVCHSLTKYLNGHSDVVGGAVLGARSIVDHVLKFQKRYGATMDPHTCFLVQRGVKTLVLRMERINSNALQLAEWLSEQEGIADVVYPGLSRHADYQRASELFQGFGGMLCFELKGGFDVASEFMRRVRIPLAAPSLGGVESLLTLPARSSHAGLSEEARRQMGISPSLIRMSVGIEAFEDLRDDLAQALMAGR